MPEVYIVIESRAKNARDRVVGVSARLQGAELIRTDWARKVADANWPDDPDMYRAYYSRLRIETHEVQDSDDA